MFPTINFTVSLIRRRVADEVRRTKQNNKEQRYIVSYSTLWLRNIYIYIYRYIYIYVYMYVYVYIYIYICTERERYVYVIVICIQTSNM